MDVDLELPCLNALSLRTFILMFRLKWGYIMALGKPVCLFKDRTLKTLHTDLIGKPYHEFDPQVPEKAISSALAKWLKDKGLARK